jgi:hypothetical protein
MARHIYESEIAKGKSKKDAKRIAWATVTKKTGWHHTGPMGKKHGSFGHHVHGKGKSGSHRGHASKSQSHSHSHRMAGSKRGEQYNDYTAGFAAASSEIGKMFRRQDDYPDDDEESRSFSSDDSWLDSSDDDGFSSDDTYEDDTGKTTEVHTLPVGYGYDAVVQHYQESQQHVMKINKFKDAHRDLLL